MTKTKGNECGILIKFVKRNKYYDMLWIVLAITFLVLSIFSDKFLSLRNFQAMALQFSALGILTLGMMVPLIVGGINLALIAIGNASCVLMAVCYFSNTLQGELVPAYRVMMYIMLTLIIGALFGALCGILIGYLQIPAMLATLALQQMCNGISLILTRGKGFTGFSDNFLMVSTRIVFKMPLCLWIFCIVIFLVSLLLKKKIVGAQFYMIGSNEKASAFSGIDIKRIQLYAYIFSGICAALGCLLMTMQYNSANVAQGDSYILKTVLICVLGGVSPLGGFGEVFGVILALVLLQFISSGLNIIGVTAFAQTSLWGFIVLIVMGINRYMSVKK